MRIAQENIKRMIYKCNRCGLCIGHSTPDENFRGYTCPSKEFSSGFEHFGARGRILMARALLEGELTYSNAFAEDLYTCLGCSACREACGAVVDMETGMLLDPVEIIRAMREDIVELGLEPENVKSLDSSVEKTHHAYKQNAEQKAACKKELSLPARGDTLYFMGCSTLYLYPEIAKTTVGILREVGIDVAFLGEEEWCCGMPQWWGGNVDLAAEVARHNIDAIKASGAKRAIFSCAGCYHAVKNYYPQLVGDLPFEVVHSSELFVDLIKEGKIQLKQGMKKVVTYHDPCHLGRGGNVYDPPREILSGIKEASFVEMPRNRDRAWCCGGEGYAYKDMSAGITKDRITEAKGVKADVIATACPLCVLQLNLEARKEGIKVYDLSVIVAESMGLKV